MSMMDAMSMGSQPQQDAAAQPPQGQQPQPGAGQPGQSGQPMQQQEFLRMADGNPEEMEKLYNKLMALISSEIWEGQGADQVAAQLNQDDSQPAEVVGKFTGFYLLMAFSAARAKGGMVPPVVIVGIAGEVAAQLTDLALMFKLVSPDQADDTADAGALIGIEVLMQHAGQQMQPDEKQEYADLTTAIIKASPTAMDMAEEGAEDAVEDVQEMRGQHPEPDEDQMGGPSDNDQDNMPPQGGSMAAAMGGA
nr:MAG: hypothetical protein [Bacteriophage sp.]